MVSRFFSASDLTSGIFWQAGLFYFHRKRFYFEGSRYSAASIPTCGINAADLISPWQSQKSEESRLPPSDWFISRCPLAIWFIRWWTCSDDPFSFQILVGSESHLWNWHYFLVRSFLIKTILEILKNLDFLDWFLEVREASLKIRYCRLIKFWSYIVVI